jgi:LPS-assembly lipoprotein
MWSLETRAISRRLARLAAAALLAAGVAGCFQPMYGAQSPTGGPGLRSSLAAVDVAQIPAPSGTALERLAVEVRNDLLFKLTGGSGSAPPSHRLNIVLSSSAQSLIVDPTTARPELENVGVDATYTLTELPSGKAVVTGSATARVSYDIPGQQQRFARLRGLRDAESRAALVITEQIRNRLASFFVAGT